MFRHDRIVLRCNINHITFHHLFYSYMLVYVCRHTHRSHWSNSKQFANQIRKPNWHLRPQIFFFLKHFSFWVELSKIWSKLFIALYVKYQLSIVNKINKIRIFSKDFQKNTQISNFTKFCGVGRAEIFHVDRQTDRQTAWWSEGQTDLTKLLFAFRNSVNVPTNR